ncbi:794_t:CDS:2 [Funneliformis geosporum]|uniref:3916_t:CDS:1 n=1 Tax=Funneliformis geosporum TaxID=1117311 RepID=A0A9W4WJC8_9GLOM|nr:3916_t:CDS:2 [Funneliformis geosporum]CAI2180967.1 794_t:CDS:2 [Funneliformis geosporum]
MPRPPRTIIKKSVLEFTKEERDLEKNTEVSKETSRINDKPIFKLKLPTELVKDLGKSSERLLNISPIQSSIRHSIEILSSSDEEYLIYDDHSSTTEVGCNRSLSPTRTLTSMEDNRKPLFEEISPLVKSRNLSQGYNLSTLERMNTQPDEEDSDDDPFGFVKAEKKIMKRNGNINQKISNNSKKSDQFENDYFQSQIIKKINDTDCYNDFLLEPEIDIDKQNETRRKQNNEESNISSENEKDENVDKDHSQPNHYEDHLSAENVKISVNLASIKIQKTPSNITKTVDLIAAVLPPRRQRFERDNEEVLNKKEEKPSPKKQKRKAHNEYKPRKVKKVTHIFESTDDEFNDGGFDNKTKQARAKRIQHFEEIDEVVLPIEIG